MPSTDPRDFRKRFVRWPYDRLREKFVPRKNPLVIPATGIFDAPYACVKINFAWVSHLIGIIETLNDLDSWQGTDEQQYLAKQEIEKLLAALEAACPEEEIVTAWRLTETCVLEYSNDNGETWIPTPGWAEFAEACFTGPQGPPGETGPAGPPGEDGECPDCGSPGTRPTPEETITDDLESLCAGAMGSVQYIIDVLNYQLDQVEAHVGAFDALLNILTLNLKEAFEVLPVVGLLSQVITYINTVGIAQLRANVNNPDFKESTACYLYCIVKRDGGLTKTGFYEWWDSLTLTEVLGALTDAGEYLKGVLTAMSGTNNFDPAFDRGYAAFSRRFAIAATNSDGSCELLCLDCLADYCDPVEIDWSAIGATPEGWALISNPETIEWTGDDEFLFVNSADDDISYGGASRAENDDWIQTMVGSSDPRGIWLEYTFPEPCTINTAKLDWTSTGGNSKATAIAIETPTGEHVIIARLYDSTPTPLEGSLTYPPGSPVEAAKIYFAFASNNGTGTQTIRLTECRVNWE